VGVIGQFIDDLGGALAGLLLGGVLLNGEDLSDTRKVEVLVEAGGDPDGAGFHASMLQGGWLAEIRFSTLLEVQADVGGEGRLLVLGDEQIVCAISDQPDRDGFEEVFGGAGEDLKTFPRYSSLRAESGVECCYTRRHTWSDWLKVY
jgi:hypothetical protein